MIITTNRVVQETKRYHCDILLKEVSAEEVVRTVDNRYVISTEAFNRLPFAIRSEPKFLDAILHGRRRYPDLKFEPEMMGVGIWVIQIPKVAYSEHFTNEKEGKGWVPPYYTDALKTVEDAVALVQQRKFSGDWYVFVDGVLVKHVGVKRKLSYEIFDHPL